MANATRSEKLDLRLTPEAKRVLNAAAQASRRSVSEFVLESALDRAQEALPDRQHFGLDAARQGLATVRNDRVTPLPTTADPQEPKVSGLNSNVLSLATPRPLPRLQRLLTEPSVFEQAPTE